MIDVRTWISIHMLPFVKSHPTLTTILIAVCALIACLTNDEDL
jgi:hypothetical protein